MSRPRRVRRGSGVSEDPTQPRAASGDDASGRASRGGAPGASPVAGRSAGVWIVTATATEVRLDYDKPGLPRRRCGRGAASVFPALRAFVCDSCQPGDLVDINGRTFYRPVVSTTTRWS